MRPRLLRVAFNTFDKAGRELGVDAAELAGRIDLATLIRSALEFSSPTVGNCSPQAMDRALGARFHAANEAIKPIADLVSSVKLG